jgi:hypothetical protein
MKKIFAVVLLAFSLGANAFFNNNDMPWNNGFNSNNVNGYQKDNGIFSYNPYDYWDPRWYMEEMSNMVDELDDEFNTNSNNSGYGYNPYSNGPWNRTATAAPAPQAAVK